MTLSIRSTLVAVAAIALLATAAFCTGERHSQLTVRTAALEAHQDTVRDTIRTVETRIVHDAPIAVATKHAADATRDTAHAALEIAQQAIQRADSAQSDSLPTLAVLPAVHACQAALVDDSIAYHAEAALLADMTEDRDAQRDRAETDEAEMKLLKPPRLGLKTGLVLGATAALAVTNPAIVVKAVKWLVGHAL